MSLFFFFFFFHLSLWAVFFIHHAWTSRCANHPQMLRHSTTWTYITLLGDRNTTSFISSSKFLQLWKENNQTQCKFFFTQIVLIFLSISKMTYGSPPFLGQLHARKGRLWSAYAGRNLQAAICQHAETSNTERAEESYDLQCTYPGLYETAQFSPRRKRRDEYWTAVSFSFVC